jgi:hypothetical protein
MANCASSNIAVANAVRLDQNKSVAAGVVMISARQASHRSTAIELQLQLAPPTDKDEATQLRLIMIFMGRLPAI